MSDEKKTVNVTATAWHTYDGQTYEVGDTYDLPEDLLDTVIAQQKAKRTHEPEPAQPKPSHPVEPMTCADFNKPS
jgi:hypothetical protein